MPMLGTHGSGAWLQRLVGATPPDIPCRVLHGQVILVVEDDRAQHVIEVMLPQRCDHGLEVQRPGVRGRLRPRLNGAISPR